MSFFKYVRLREEQPSGQPGHSHNHDIIFIQYVEHVQIWAKMVL